MDLTRNVGGADKTIRIIVGIVMIVLMLFADLDATWEVVAGVVAAISLVTAFVGFCPLNKLLGINTCRYEHDR